MKMLMVILLIVFLPMVSYGRDSEDGNGKLEKIRAKLTDELNKKIRILEKEKSCVQKIKTRQDYMVCKNETKKSLTELRSKRKED